MVWFMPPIACPFAIRITIISPKVNKSSENKRLFSCVNLNKPPLKWKGQAYILTSGHSEDGLGHLGEGAEDFLL